MASRINAQSTRKVAIDGRVDRLFSRRLVRVSVLSGILCYLVWLYFGDPTDVNGYYPKCVFYQLTGLKCLGCGGQRAVHFLMHGDMARALHYNFFLIGVMPAYILGLFKGPFHESKWYVYLGVAAIFVFMILRNLPGADF